MRVRQRQESGGQGAWCMHQNSEWDGQAQTQSPKHKVAAFNFFIFFYFCCLLDLEMESSATKFELYASTILCRPGQTNRRSSC
jgi:hypothetical protein